MIFEIEFDRQDQHEGSNEQYLFQNISEYIGVQ